MWARYHFGKPQKCENCGTTEKRMYHWANISGTYIRERSDWIRLCVPCHKQNDIKALGGRIRSRTKKLQPSKFCAECGVKFFKNPHLSKKQWSTNTFCSKQCSAKVTGRKLLGTQQSETTRKLKSQRLKERWESDEWRKRISDKMRYNQFARKHW